MTAQDLIKKFHTAAPDEKILVTLLALHGEALGKTRLLECLRRLGVRDGSGKIHAAGSLAETMAQLRRKGFISDEHGSGFVCAAELNMPALREALDEDSFERLCAAVEACCPLGMSYSGFPYLRSYRQGLARLRMALLRGQPPEEVHPWLAACMQFRDYGQVHPFVELCGRPFEPDLFARLHPLLQENVMAHLLSHALAEPETAPPLRDWARQYLARGGHDASLLRFALAEHWLVCGRLEEAWALVKDDDTAGAQFVRAAILLLRGDHGSAVPAFEAALKTLRKEQGKRNIVMDGPCGYLYALAMMRSGEPKYRKQAETCLELALRTGYRPDMQVYLKLSLLHQVQGGTSKAEAALELERSTGPQMLPQLFQALLCYWLGLPEAGNRQAALAELLQRAEAAGFHFIAAQAGELLARLGEARHGGQAAALRRQYGLDDLCDWFERQEAWQRQLSALIGLHQTAAVPKSDAQARLVWLVAYEPRHQMARVEPREQKRDAKGNWSKGRAVALARLREGSDQLGYLTPQDARVTAAIGLNSSYNYYGGSRYELDDMKALAALAGHPLVFWRDAPEVRVEVLRGEPELLIKESAGKVRLSLQPAIDPEGRDVLISKETPTRLRILKIGDEHRRIAAILGGGLSVPAQAKERVLQAVSAVSSLITVQSDIGGGATDVEQVDADGRLHVHLLPWEAGLKMQILVKPFADGGPCYAPGQGTESVIAEVNGKRLQARRDLAAERKAAKALKTACAALETAEESHGEWRLAEPQPSLELLLQLQACADGVVIAWPEGEKFRVGAQLDSRQMRLAVKSERDWFAVSGQLQVDDDTVLDLRQLLELVSQSPGRFVALDGNRFLALTEEFHRRLSELAAFGEMHRQGVRVHPLAAFALEELADDAGSVKADKEWKRHLARLAELDTLEPQVPGTLQAELRDYQLMGFRWLARLAHWGVGACLADDMGLGKTVQALALILSRAPQGPTLVVAPTSVCMNWQSEAARFAPTLNVILFGSGDRNRTLAELQPLDLVIVSYGLLQQEAELFAGVHWRTIVLDEAQAIKNALTKRSQAVMALSADFRMAATGTPLENHLGELWNLFRFINPGLLGSQEQFNQRFATPIEREQDAVARARLRRLIQPFILRRTKTQVLAELPSRTEIVREVDLSKDEAVLYEALRRSALEKLAADDAPAGQKSLQILAEIMKLRRACCNPQLVAPELGIASSKLAAFGELLDELLENRHKALVFSQFVDHLSLIRAELDQRGLRYQYLDGATTMRERKKRVDAFQSGDGDVFLISLKAGGTGLNLTAADYVIHMDPWWNPAVEDQASDRAHRMGQQRPVTIYRLVARHTIEERIVDLHRHKRDLADSLLEGSDVAGKMSAQEMLGMLQHGLG
ncbi:DEAD/DEAH box helicase [Noviherbaspirillum cavernae]|uniref:DEAD/DEAH box helicase n=1 Tax=Noviherbaspirillum cavernae TaxID=2320862 RepID=A0A418WWN5_9BURK|nr:DEAD/DEAH box helicase [Noviherbaspirillum cavernae]RJG04649.1 DEAD/DEAH box helicase [Noviherbaspirillum cavernae]